MDIRKYDDVDPVQVLDLNVLCLGYSLTPERMTLIRRLDPRPFPGFGVYAVEDGIVVGQVGVYRLPMMTAEGPEDVGGVCAVCGHPAYSGRGTAARLLDEAHAEMRAAGLRFSSLGTQRYRTAHGLYRRHGYEDVFAPVAALVEIGQEGPASDLLVRRADPAGYETADDLFRRIATGRLGFARRPEGFLPMMVATGEVEAEEFWLVWKGSEAVGYALAKASGPLLRVNNLLLEEGTDAAAAVVALARETGTRYAQVRAEHPSVAASLRKAGWPETLRTWDTFMLKPLTSGTTVEDARRLFGIGTERFLLSKMDIT